MDITASILSQRDRALIGGDYSAYHTQATRRIQRIRGRLGVSTPRGKKYTSKNEVTAADVAKNTEFVHTDDFGCSNTDTRMQMGAIVAGQF